ncbi:hypothetical protein MRX96_012780 [Rhipicephalus microplus]
MLTISSPSICSTSIYSFGHGGWARRRCHVVRVVRDEHYCSRTTNGTAALPVELVSRDVSTETLVATRRTSCPSPKRKASSDGKSFAAMAAGSLARQLAL